MEISQFSKYFNLVGQAIVDFLQDTSVAPTVINLEITGSDKSSVWQPGSAYTTKIDENNANFKHVVPVPESVVNGISVNVKASGTCELHSTFSSLLTEL